MGTLLKVSEEKNYVQVRHVKVPGPIDSDGILNLERRSHNPLLRALVGVLKRLEVFKEMAREFYFEVLLSLFQAERPETLLLFFPKIEIDRVNFGKDDEKISAR